MANNTNNPKEKRRRPREGREVDVGPWTVYSGTTYFVLQSMGWLLHVLYVYLADRGNIHYEEARRRVRDYTSIEISEFWENKWFHFAGRKVLADIIKERYKEVSISHVAEIVGNVRII